MDPIYDAGGSVRAWLDGDVVRTLGGSVVAFIMNGEQVVSTGGNCVGWLEEGWLKDSDGHALGFLATAGFGPSKPMKGLTPLRPLRGLRPLTPMTPMKPVKPARSRSWGRLWLDEWVRLIA